MKGDIRGRGRGGESLHSIGEYIYTSEAISVSLSFFRKICWTGFSFSSRAEFQALRNTQIGILFTNSIQ